MRKLFKKRSSIQMIDSATLALDYRRRHTAHLGQKPGAEFAWKSAALLAIGLLWFLITICVFCY